MLLSSTGIEPATIQAASYVMFSDVGSKDSSGANGKRCFCLNGKNSGGIERMPGRYTKLMFTFLFRMAKPKSSLGLTEVARINSVKCSRSEKIS